MPNPTPAASAPLRVLVVDSDDRIRESLSRLLLIDGRCLVVGSAGLPGRALDLCESVAPDVVVVDSRLPEAGTDRTFVELLRDVCPEIKIVVLNWSGAAGAQVRLPGADAYIRKTFRPQELIDAVVHAARGPVA